MFDRGGLGLRGRGEEASVDQERSFKSTDCDVLCPLDVDGVPGVRGAPGGGVRGDIGTNGMGSDVRGLLR